MDDAMLALPSLDVHAARCQCSRDIHKRLHCTSNYARI